MKHFSTKNSATLKAIFIVMMLAFVGIKTANACHGVMIVNPTQTINPTDVVINGSSDPATCGCGPYWMEVEVTCNPNGFTGAPPAPSSPIWGTGGQWFHSTLNPPSFPEQCILEPYFPVTIPFNQLCPGTQYYWRVREFVEVNSAGPWSGTFTFTTPGLPPSAILSTTSVLQSTGNPQYSGCPGDIFQFNANVSGGCPGATFSYQWTPATGLSNANVANPVCTLSTNIQYTVTATGGCFTITSNDDTVNLTIGPAPTAGMPTAMPDSVCSGQSSTVVLSGQSAGAIQWEVSTNGVNWFNVPGATNDTLLTGPLSNTLYYHAIVTGTGWPGTGCGTATSTAAIVTVNQSPVANAGPNASVCAGGCLNLTGTGGVTYNWMPGNLSGSTVNVCPPGTTNYTLVITDANGCSDSDMVQINIANPYVNASPSVSVCNGNSTILVASGGQGQSYSWLPNSTLTGASSANPTATPTATTVYTVTATDPAGCTATDSVLVQVTSAPPVVASNDTSLCNGGSALLVANGSATTYTWNPGNQSGQSISVSPINTTTYVVTASTNNCISYDTVVVTVAPPFNVYAGPDFDVCSGTQITLNVGVSNGIYSWTPTPTIIGSSTTQSVIAAPTANTSYTINVTDANGCISADTISVTVHPNPTINASTPDNSICVGQTTSVSASGGSAYVWTPNVGVTSPTMGTTNVNPTNTTVYTVTGTDLNGCTGTDTVTIFVTPLPSVAYTSTPTECGDSTGTINLQSVIIGTPPMTYSIGASTVTMPISGLPMGAYPVTATDANGCSSTVTMWILMQNTAFVNASANPTFGTYPLPVSFGASASPGVNSYTWSFGDGNFANGASTNNTYTQPNTYQVVVQAFNDDAACSVYDTLYITVVEEATVSLPNVFTPNDDLQNDHFSAIVSGVLQMDVKMYDRWGALVYEGTQANISSNPQIVNLWDGKKGGKAAADGVYYYVVTATGYDQNIYPFAGYVQLITTPQP